MSAFPRRQALRHIHTEDDQTGAKCSSGGFAASCLEGQEHGGNGHDTHDGGQKSHGNVGNARLKVVLSNIFKVKLSIETGQPTGESNEELGEWRVDVHEELALDVLGGETTKAVGLVSEMSERCSCKSESRYWTSSKTTLVGW